MNAQEAWNREYGNAFAHGHAEGHLITEGAVALWYRWYARGFQAGLRAPRDRDAKGRFVPKNAGPQ